MSSRDIFGMCLRNLFKRKLRTFLTILGVVIGTACIVVMVSMGLAADANFQKMLENFGDITLINVWDYSGMNYGSTVNVISSSQGGGATPPKLDDNMLAKFEEIPGVVVATPLERGNLYFKSGKNVMDGYMCYGIKAEAMSAMGLVPAQGRLLQEGDQYEVVFGFYAEAMFRDPNDPNGWDRQWMVQSEQMEYVPLVDIFNDKITMSYDQNYIWGNQNMEQEFDPFDENAPKPIKPYNINVVGLLEEKKDSMLDQGIFFDIEIFKRLRDEGQKQSQSNNQEYGWYSAIKGSQQTGYQEVYVKCANIDVVKQVNDKIKELGFSSYYPAQQVDELRASNQSTQNLLLGVGIMSLIVAAIGIANTMIMSIYERTREIGVMKVIGAAIRDIRWMFLLESAMIGLLGGLFGVGLSYFASYAFNNWGISLTSQPGMEYYMPEAEEGVKNIVSLITPWLSALALAFASLVGLISGYFPARRATKLSALSAIRTE
ncbi:MAG: ABC transporter permease [Clostridiales bacterium]|jgi:ABC-type antimicrobial peptide transport system permease subunit|nr:ABC transporter permease [Clostridiales bacterium]